MRFIKQCRVGFFRVKKQSSLKIARRQTSNSIMGQNKYQWRKRRIGRIEILLHRAVWETALNKKYGGAGSIP